MITEIFRVILYFASFIIVILLAFFFTKYLAKKSTSLNRGQNSKIIEIMSLGNNSRILIVEIFGVIYVVYDNNSHILLLDKHNKEDINVIVKDSIADKDYINNLIERAMMQKGNLVKKLKKKM